MIISISYALKTDQGCDLKMPLKTPEIWNQSDFSRNISKSMTGFLYGKIIHSRAILVFLLKLNFKLIWT
jgi:hypothetical protein